MKYYILIIFILLTNIINADNVCNKFYRAFKNKDSKQCISFLNSKYTNRLWTEGKTEFSKKMKRFFSKNNFELNEKIIVSESFYSLKYYIYKEKFSILSKKRNQNNNRSIIYITKNIGGEEKIISRVKVSSNKVYIEEEKVDIPELGLEYYVPKKFMSYSTECKKYYMRHIMISENENSILSITAIQTPYPVSAETVAKGDKQVLSRKTKNFKGHKINKFRVSGLEAASFESEFKFSNEMRYRKSIYIKQGRTIYAVLADSADKNYKIKLYKALKHLIYSISFHKPIFKENNDISISNNILKIKDLNFKKPKNWFFRIPPSKKYIQCFIEPDNGRSAIRIIVSKKKMSFKKMANLDIRNIKSVAIKTNYTKIKMLKNNKFKIAQLNMSFNIESLGKVYRIITYLEYNGYIYKIISDGIPEIKEKEIKKVLDELLNKIIITRR